MTRLPSAPEQLLAVQLEQAGIHYVREYRFAQVMDPPRQWRADFLIDESSTFLVEIEGGSWVSGRHTRGKGYEADLEKYNAATELGWQVYRFTPRQVEEGWALKVIRRVLSRRSAA